MLKNKLSMLLLMIAFFISTITIFLVKEYYLLNHLTATHEKHAISTIKTLKTLLLFVAKSVNENASNLQNVLFNHYAYNLIFDSDSIVNKSQIFAINGTQQINPLGLKPQEDILLLHAEMLSKTNPDKVVLFSKMQLETIYLLYTAGNSVQTYVLSFPFNDVFISKHTVPFDKTKSPGKDITYLNLFNAFAEDEFISEMFFVNNKPNYVDKICHSHNKILSLFCLHLLLLGLYKLYSFTSTQKTKKLCSKLETILGVSAPELIFDKFAYYQSSITSLEQSLQKSIENSISQKAIIEIYKKSIHVEKQANSTIANNLSRSLQRMSTMINDTLHDFDKTDMSKLLIKRLLTTIQASTAKLLLLKSEDVFSSDSHLTNVKSCFINTLSLFAPALLEINCLTDVSSVDDSLFHKCHEIVLLQIFNGAIDRLLFSMESADGNFIKAETLCDSQGYILKIYNTGLGINPNSSQHNEDLSFSNIIIPNWISTKALAKKIGIHIEETHILGKGSNLTIYFNNKLSEDTHACLSYI